jgi:hypothetical protein
MLEEWILTVSWRISIGSIVAGFKLPYLALKMFCGKNNEKFEMIMVMKIRRAK